MAKYDFAELSDDESPDGATFAGVRGVSAGARFYRADLHIHSFGGSDCVVESNMTPKAIVDAAIKRGIEFLALTDHNNVSNVRALMAAADATSGAVHAIPGIEITTSCGHVLAYCAPDKIDDLESWLSGTRFSDDESGGKYTRKQIDKIAEEIHEFGGIVVPAHVGNQGSGFLAKAPYRECQAVFESRHVLAVELEPDYASWFTASDTSHGHESREDYMAKRRDSLKPLGSRLARLIFSDAHSLDRVGLTPDGKERLTRIKMEKPSFDGFLVALRDPDARVVLEGTIPDVYPRIVGVRYVGGFLDGQEIAFAPNLTALIGGRGAGKSTAIEALRTACMGSASKISESPAWPSTVQIEFLDALGTRHLAQRDSGADSTYEVVEGEAVPVLVPLEGYSQDRIAEIVRGSETNPSLLLGFFDQYVEDGQSSKDLDDLRARLDENAELLAPLEDAPGELLAANKGLAAVQAKIKTAATTKAHEALRYRRMLHSERQLRSAIVELLNDLERQISDLELAPDLNGLAAESGISDLSKTTSPSLVVGAEGSTEDTLQKAFADLAKSMTVWQTSGIEQLKEYRTRVDAILKAWEERDKRIEARIQTIVEKLRADGVPTDIKALNNLASEESTAQKAVATQSKRLTEQKRLSALRKKLLGDYRKAQDRRSALRTQLGNTLSQQFRDAGVEFQVGIKFRQGQLVADFEQWLRRQIGNRFLRGDRVTQLCENIHPIELAEDARSSDTKRLVSLKDDSGKAFFTGVSEAQEFIACLKRDPSELLKLESITRDDCPEVTVTVNRSGSPFVAPFQQLSFGQKTSILLGVLLFSDRTEPLVIDQPEDHLDSAFIYDSVVKTLRLVKERRQVIVATHNANIAILGDAELIVPLRSWGDRGNIIDRGSVDTLATRKRSCTILEGGEQAYRRRGEMYGLS